MQLGASERSDGTFVWPDQTEHYIIAHRVWTPEHELLANAVVYSIPPPSLSLEPTSENQMGDHPYAKDVKSTSVSIPEDAGFDFDIGEIDIGLGLESGPNVVDANFGQEVSSSPTAEVNDFDSLFGDEISLSPETPPAPEHRAVRPSKKVALPRLTELTDQPRYTSSTEEGSAVSSYYGLDSAAQEIVTAYPKRMGNIPGLGKVEIGVDLPLARKIVTVAHNIGAHPHDLANLINFESATSFRADVRHPSSKATGLIQFYPGYTKRRLGITTAKLGKMTPLKQMEWVQAYFESVQKEAKGTPLNTIHKLAMAVFYPVALNWSSGKSFPANVQDNNPGIATPHDYVQLMLRRAKLGPSAVAYQPEPQGPGLMSQLGSWLGSMWSDPALSPVAGPVAGPVSTPTVRRIGPTWSVTGNTQARLASSSGTYGPGPVPPGQYRLEVARGQGWATASPTALTLRDGHEYQLSTPGGRLDWGERRVQ